METVSPLESDRPRAQYSHHRLRAWTRLYSSQQSVAPFLPLTTSEEVSAEIFERLPSQLVRIPGEKTTAEPLQCRLSLLPDPRSLSLDEVLGLRESLEKAGVLPRWWQAVAAAIHRLERESLSEGLCDALSAELQE